MRQKKVGWVIYGVEYLILVTEKYDRGTGVYWGVCVGILGLRWGPQWSGMVDMPIPDRYEIG